MFGACGTVYQSISLITLQPYSDDHRPRTKARRHDTVGIGSVKLSAKYVQQNRPHLQQMLGFLQLWTASMESQSHACLAAVKSRSRSAEHMLGSGRLAVRPCRMLGLGTLQSYCSQVCRLAAVVLSFCTCPLGSGGRQAIGPPACF
jgi:hypothetical protein